MSITFLHEEILIFIEYGCVNISHHGLLLRTTYGVLMFFSVSRLNLWKVIAGGGIALIFLRGQMAKYVIVHLIQEKVP